MTVPIEGFFLVSNEGLIFEVKGNVQPDDYFIAYLRYVVDTSGDRVTNGGTSYRKVYPLQEREEYLQSNYPKYLKFEKKYNRVLQVIQHHDIAYTLNPVEKLHQLRDRGTHVSERQLATIQLAESLVDVFKVSLSVIGVTGSQLIGLESDKSDIDLVVYGEDSGRKIQHGLKHASNDIIGLQKYENSLLRNHVEFRWGLKNPEMEKLSIIERNKALQGVFKGIEFFIRLVKTPDEISARYDDRTFESVGTRVLRCKVLDDSQSIFTPCEYTVQCTDIPTLTSLISYRGRFTEHVQTGMNVEVRGRLEEVVMDNGVTWSHLVLGESKEDYLIPLDQ